jgi:integrase
LKNGEHYSFRQADGQLATAMSTRETSKGAAEAWALNCLRERGAPRPGGGLTFAAYAVDWWVWGSCPYIASKEARGFRISHGYADRRHYWLHKFVLPQFGERRLAEITPASIEAWVMGLYREGRLSPASVNRILGTLKVMLQEAVRLGHLMVNPASAVGELKETPRERGVFSLDELHRLFGPGTLGGVWAWDPRHYAANMLAAATAMRIGEVRGLQRRNVHAGHVAVLTAWGSYGLTVPKWNGVRLVPIPAAVQTALQNVMEGSPHVDPEDLVFWGANGRHPLSATALLGALRKALVRIGVSLEEQRTRNLCFHSHRHTLNTVLRGKVSGENLRRVTGHKTLALTDNYDHPGIEHLEDVRREQEALFGSEKGAEHGPEGRN